MLTVHLRINDTATGKPTPVRLRISGPDATTYPPLGRVAEFATGRNEDVGAHLRLGRDRWCYVDGSCEVKLPAAVPLRVQATKGPLYEPLDQTVILGPGQMALRFTVGRWTNLGAEGWVSGDTRCHFIPPHAALLEAAAEDLGIVNLLACSQPVPSLDGTAYPSFPHLTAFSGQAAALEADDRLVAVNTLNVHPVLGKVGLLHSHRVVFPITFGGDEETDDWSVCDWCDQCHRKGGLTVWVDAFRPAAGLLGGEGLVAAVLGKIDAVEVDDLPRAQPLLPWVYRLWNAGVMVPLAGGSGKDSNKVLLGGMRTYARVLTSPERERGEPYHDWVEAVRAGRTFVTNGPLIRLTVSEAGRTDAAAESLRPFEKLEVVLNGAVIGCAGPTPNGRAFAAALAVEPTVAQSSWVAARVLGADGVFAHTSPVVVRLNDRPSRRPEATADLARLIEQTRDWVTDHGRFANPKSRAHLLELCGTALARLGGTP
jgi:hypothetical protein